MEKNNQQQSIRKSYSVGQTFGCLTILECLDNGKLKVQCTCGNILELGKPGLYNYHKTNKQWCNKCKPAGVNKTKHHKGEILGNCFELIKHLGGNKWEVKCIKCGKIQEQAISNIKRHKGETCYYCLHPNALRNSPGGKGILSGPIEERFYNYYKSRIESDNLKGKKFKEWNLSLEEFTGLVRGNCVYCGCAPRVENQWANNKRKTSLDEDYSFNGIDRVDSNKGYTIDNCVSCCPKCNRMKSDLDKDDFLSHVSKIYNFSNKCSTTIEST